MSVLNWEESIARISAIASYIAYCKNADDMKTKSTEFGFDFAERVPVGEKNSKHVAYLLRKGRILVVAFRGTDRLSDWITNLKSIWGSNVGDGTIAGAGFQRAAQSLKKPIIDQVDALSSPIDVIVLTGHSLGGAMAVLSALDVLSTTRAMERHVVTFGQPRVFWKNRSAAFDKIKLSGLVTCYQRYVCSIDGVVNVPGFPFWHIGDMHYFDHHGELRGETGFLKRLGHAFMLAAKFKFFMQIKSHKIAGYVALVCRAHGDPDCHCHVLQRLEPDLKHYFE